MTRIAYFPVVENEEQLTDLVSRAAWFLTFSPIERISVFIADPGLAQAEWRVVPGMDPRIAERFEALRSRIEFVPVARAEDIETVLDEASQVLRWGHGTSRWLDGETASSLLAGKKIFDVDPEAIRQEGGNYIDVGWKLMPDRKAVIEENRRRFNAVASRIGRFDEGFVLATGPSVGEYTKLDFDGKFRLVCNTAILNDHLMKTVDPHFVVFADPIFHFGPSQFAGRFREAVHRAAERFDFTICIPFKYLAVFAAAMPDLIERTVAIPFEKDREFNFDLVADFELRTTANVLTMVMIPVAATFAQRIGILGCDGRPLNEDKYFWGHHPTTQINDKMANIREVHPGFFNIDYNDYYLEHCQVLEEQLSAGERAGYGFECLADSHIPALKRRKGSRDDQRAAQGHPRLLVIDSTRTGALNATGQVKKAWLAGWPDDSFMQLWAPRGDGGAYSIARRLRPDADTDVSSAAEISDAVAAFNPDVIYYRPTIDQHPRLHSIAWEIIEDSGVPLATQIMDDWPSRLEAIDPVRGAEADQALRDVLARSYTALSISAKMSDAFRDRYGREFEPIANGVDVDLYRRLSDQASRGKEGREEVVFRYCGALAKDMTLETVVDIAHAVEAVRREIPVSFEVYSMPMWQADFRAAVAGLHSVQVFDSVPDDEYPSLLADADVLVLGYNFDAESLRYVRLSMPNKLPEYLASGAAVLAVGPREANGIDYIRNHEVGVCITERNADALVGAVRRLAASRTERMRMGAKGQKHAFRELDLSKTSARFRRILGEAAEAREQLLGPFERDADVQVDESEVVARILNAEKRSGVLLDVGAHHGSSLLPFARAGWTVLACEPDPANRAMLAKRTADLPNVRIDERAVSDQPSAGAAFFASAQSTGISSLHAFHDSHVPSGAVPVTTVDALLGEYDLQTIDFLKIDVEGLDWNVLRGVPWDRVRPKVIECEFEDLKTLSLGHTYRDMAEFLVERGYSVYVSEWHPIVRYGIKHQWRSAARYPYRVGSERAWGNLLAFRDDPGPAAVRDAFESCVRRARKPTIHPTEVGRETEGRSANSQTHLPPGHRLYERLYLWARDRNPLTFLAGRITMWLARKVRRYPLATLLFLVLVAGLATAGTSSDGAISSVAWVASAALVLAGIGIGIIFGFLLKAARHELKLDINVARELHADSQAAIARLNGEIAKLRQRLDAEEAALAELRDFQRTHERAADPTTLRRRVSLGLARLRANSVTATELLLVLAPERSGSTWLFDLLRSHPSAIVLPTADVYRWLEVQGRRYPMHLSDGDAADLDIEAQDGIGACIPNFKSSDLGQEVVPSTAVEKIHPSAARLDLPGFERRLQQAERKSGMRVRCCYLSRDPLESLRSFAAHEKRVPGWSGTVSPEAVPTMYLRSYEFLCSLIEDHPGPVIRFEDLVGDPTEVLERTYGWLWPDLDAGSTGRVAAETIRRTERSIRARHQSGPFLAAQEPAPAGDLELLLREDAGSPESDSYKTIIRARQLREQLSEKGATLPGLAAE